MALLVVLLAGWPCESGAAPMLCRWSEIDRTDQRPASVQDRDSERQTRALLMQKGDTALARKQLDDAIQHFTACADLSRTANDRPTLGEALSKVATIYQQMGNFEKSIKVANEALAVQREDGDLAGMSKTLSKIGTSHFFSGKYELAIDHYGQSLEIRGGIADSAGMGDLLLNIGSVHSALGNYVEALDHYMRSLDIRKDLGDLGGTAAALNNIGTICKDQGRYEKAIEYYSESLRIREKSQDRQGMVSSLVNIGTVYQAQGFHQEALTRYEAALEMLEKDDDQKRMGAIINNIGSVYQELGDLDKAMRHYNRCSDIMERTGNRSGYAATLSSIGQLLILKGDVEQAAATLAKSLTIRRSIGDRKGMASSFIGLADAQMKRNEVAKAVQLADSAIVIAKEVGAVAVIRDAAAMLHKGYRILGRYQQSLDMHELYMTMRDSINNAESQRTILRQQFQFDFDRREALMLAEKEKAEAVAREEIRRKNLERNASFGGLGLVLLLAGVFLVQRNRIGKERDRSDGLLLNILPVAVAEELKEKGEAEAQLFEQVTVLFTDFKGFTAMSEQLSPKELVKDLHECFSQFDHICEKHGIEKIKTIGDAYMAAGGLPTPNTTHATDVVKAALEMAEVVELGKAKKIAAGLPYFEIRIGVHTGPVVAGIVGIKKFQYDIWGDTVNTASRMESSGEVGRVNISEATYALVKDQFACEFRGEVEAKGKGKLGMWFVSAT
ncbi:MAG: tetratricopeptide repeat protein [Flavobacteriales bacterium]|nr:tetratricopeptide repeat protein [Flavobacteriales bacterium]